MQKTSIIFSSYLTRLYVLSDDSPTRFSLLLSNSANHFTTATFG